MAPCTKGDDRKQEGKDNKGAKREEKDDQGEKKAERQGEPAKDKGDDDRAAKRDLEQRKELEKLREKARQEGEKRLEEAENKRPDFTPKAELRGRIHADAVVINQSPRNKETFGDVENATGFRRARLGAEGTVGPQGNWICEFDFAGGEIQFMDVWVGVDKLPLLGQVQVGHFREPYSLEAQTSSNYITFIERSLMNALDPGRNWGVAFFTQAFEERATYSLGGFRTGTDVAGQDVSDDGDWAVITRGTYLLHYDPFTEGASLLHVGGTFSHRLPIDEVLSIRENVEARLISVGTDDDPFFLDNVVIPARHYQLYGLEWAWQQGPLLLQAEWTGAPVEQLGGPPVFLQGCYAQATLLLTGEHRNYDRKQGSFEGVTVRRPFVCFWDRLGFARGWGAWEVAGRVSYLDFEDDDIPADEDDGGKVGDRAWGYTVGLNWYLNEYMRFMFNYNYTVIDNPNTGHSVANLFELRYMVYW